MSGPATPLSLNEIGFYFTRAAVGAGAPFGIGEDFAETCKRISYLGLDPAAAAVPALRGLADGTSGTALALRRSAAELRIESGDGSILSALYAGPSIADWLSIEAARGETRSLLLDKTDQPLLIAGAIASVDLPTARIAISWRRPGGGHAAVELHRGVAMIAGLDGTDIAALGPAGVEVALNGSGAGAPVSSRTAAKRLADGRADAVEHGVVVDGAAWSTVFEHFARCLVPSTNLSRAAGAGPDGSTDND